jgi:hypothetical protein
VAEQRDPSGSTPEQPYTVHDDAAAPAVPTGSTTPSAPEQADVPLASQPARGPDTVAEPAPGPAHEPDTVAEPAPGPAHRGPDPVALLAGLAALAVAVLALTGSLTAVDLRWVLAGGAVVVGVVVLVAASRPRARREG